MKHFRVSQPAITRFVGNSIFVTICMLLTALSSAAAPAAATTQAMELHGYQLPDGAITLFLAGDSVDPYFATKALLAAHQAGANVAPSARAWIGWLLPRQQPNGTFDRYCRRDWKFVACADADADDALLATWIELLVTFAPAEGMPPAWAESLSRASRYLLTLRDQRLGVFNISGSMPVALLMDNIEVLSAFSALAHWQQAQGNVDGSLEWRDRAQALTASIERVFRSANGSYRISTQNRHSHDFYPDQVAQLFPILGGLDDTHGAATFEQWLRGNRVSWFAQASHDYPWALAALAAYQVGDHHTVACWRAHAAPFRHGSHWNVLEEALFLALATPSAEGVPVSGCDGENGK